MKPKAKGSLSTDQVHCMVWPTEAFVAICMTMHAVHYKVSELILIILSCSWEVTLGKFVQPL